MERCILAQPAAIERKKVSHEHSHSNFQSLRHENVKRLGWACAITSSFMLVEAITGYMTNSLALMADAGHMLADVASLLLALLAGWFATKNPNSKKTFGYYRSEILSGFVTGILLIGISIFLLVEAYGRLNSPVEVNTVPMLFVAVLGLFINLGCAKILHGAADKTVNIKAAYLEVMADLLASVGVIIAGVIMLFTGWYLVDLLVSVGIAIWIIPRTWRLLSECTNILMEGSPTDISVSELKIAMEKVEGVREIHDVHVWSITSDLKAMSSHLSLEADAYAEDVLKKVTALVQEEFQISHTTIQVEESECASNGNNSCGHNGKSQKIQG